MKINSNAIRAKFGNDYWADEYTFIMGIDRRFTEHFAERFNGMSVLETCTGGGFTTMSLARSARLVVTVEVDKARQGKAIKNVEKAGLSSNISFISGSILDPDLLNDLPPVDAVFIDPDWASTGPDHIYRFLPSNTIPPADIVLEKMLAITENVAIVLPPFINSQEFVNLPEHEREMLYLGKSHELYCLYFGKLKRTIGETVFQVNQ